MRINDIALAIFTQCYNIVRESDGYNDDVQDLEVVIDDVFYNVTARLISRHTSFEVFGGTYDMPAEYDETLSMSIRLESDVRCEDENENITYIPKQAITTLLAADNLLDYEE